MIENVLDDVKSEGKDPKYQAHSQMKGCCKKSVESAAGE